MTRPDVARGSPLGGSLGTSVAIFWGPPSTSRPPAIPWFAYLIATPLHSRTHARTHTVCSSSQYQSVDGRETVAKRPGFLASCRSASLVGLYCHHPNLSAQSHRCFSFFCVCVCVCWKNRTCSFSTLYSSGAEEEQKIYIYKKGFTGGIGLGIKGRRSGCHRPS